MGWHLAISNMPDKPYAVISNKGAIAGCHASRASASLQMTQLNLDGATDADVEAARASEAPKKSEPEQEENCDEMASADERGLGKAPSRQPSISYSTPTTMMW